MLSHGEQGCPKQVSFQNILRANLKKVPRVHQNPRYTLMKAHLRLWANLPRTLDTQEQEFVEAVEMYQYSGNQTWKMSPSPTHKTDYQNRYRPDGYYKDVHSTDKHFVDICTIAVGPATGTVFPIISSNLQF